MAGPQSRPAVVYVLARLVLAGVEAHHERRTVGVFSTIKRAEQEASRIIGREVGERIQKLPAWFPSRRSDTLTFAYGRDHHDFRFEISPWAVDAESS